MVIEGNPVSEEIKGSHQTSGISKKSIITFILLGIVVLALLVFFGDYKQILEYLPKINLVIIPLLILCTLVNYVLRFVKWEYFLRVLGIRVTLSNSFLVFLSGLSMAITPGKVGEVFKSYLLKQSDQVEMSKSIMVVVAERLTDVFSLAILSLLGLSSFLMRWYALVFIFVIVVLLVLLLRSESAFTRFRSVATRVPIIKRYIASLDEAFGSSRKLLTLRPLIAATSLSVASWFFECLALYILVKSLGYSISVLEATFVFSFSSIFGSVLVLPGGLGAAEASFMALLVALNLPKSVGAIATIIIRVCTLWFGVALGLFSLWLFRVIILSKRPLLKPVTKC
jgi:uncharacterized protein (TIRG00374 family)